MFKSLKQLGAIIILSLILINSITTVFAATSTTYEECIQAFKSDNTNYAACDAMRQDAEKCFTDAEASFKEICNNNATCIQNLKNDPQSLALCLEKDNTAKECTTKAEQSFEEICRAQFPAQTSSGTSGSSSCGNGIFEDGEGCDDGNVMSGDGCDSKCMTETTVPPAIPKIRTLPGPDAPTVGNVSPYLMSTFLPRIARTVISFAIGAAVLGLILSSIGLLTAYGNEEKYGNAKKGLLFSIIGLMIALLAFAIVQLVFFTGFQIGNIT